MFVVKSFHIQINGQGYGSLNLRGVVFRRNMVNIIIGYLASLVLHNN